MAKGILIAVMDFSAAPEDEFHDWYDLEHIPERLRVPGFLNADRWIGTENPKISVATYDLDNVGVLHSAPYLAVGGENGSPWTKRTAKFRKGILRCEGEQLFPGDRTAPAEAAALFMIGMNVGAQHEHEFNEWYNNEHIPALGAQRLDGVLVALLIAAQLREPVLQTRFWRAREPTSGVLVPEAPMHHDDLTMPRKNEVWRAW